MSEPPSWPRIAGRLELTVLRNGEPLAGARLPAIGRRVGDPVARARGELLGSWQGGLELGLVLLPSLRIGTRHGVARLGQGRVELLVPLDPRELAQALDLALRLLDQSPVIDDAPPLRRQLLEVGEQDASRHRPLLGDDLRQWLAGQLAPLGGQHQRPRRPGPAGELRVGDEPLRLPGRDHVGEALARLAVDVDEERVGEDGVEERDPERVLVRLLQHPQAGRVLRRRVAVAIADLGEEGGAQPVRDPRQRVGGGEAVAVPAAGSADGGRGAAR